MRRHRRLRRGAHRLDEANLEQHLLRNNEARELHRERRRVRTVLVAQRGRAPAVTRIRPRPQRLRLVLEELWLPAHRLEPFLGSDAGRIELVGWRGERDVDFGVVARGEEIDAVAEHGIDLSGARPASYLGQAADDFLVDHFVDERNGLGFGHAGIGGELLNLV